MLFSEKPRTRFSKRQLIHRFTNYLGGTCADPDSVENWIRENPFEDVSLPVDFPGVEFVEKCHHDEGVENYGKMLSGFGHNFVLLPWFDVQ